MKIEISEFTREDGLTLLRVRGDEAAPETGLWVIRRIHGPAWFWNSVDSKWEICTRPGFDHAVYALPLDRAMALFRTVSQ